MWPLWEFEVPQETNWETNIRISITIRSSTQSLRWNAIFCGNQHLDYYEIKQIQQLFQAGQNFVQYLEADSKNRKSEHGNNQKPKQSKTSAQLKIHFSYLTPSLLNKHGMQCTPFTPQSCQPLIGGRQSGIMHKNHYFEKHKTKKSIATTTFYLSNGDSSVQKYGITTLLHYDIQWRAAALIMLYHTIGLVQVSSAASYFQALECFPSYDPFNVSSSSK